MPDLTTPEGASRSLVALLEAGDADAIAALYEDGAVFVDMTTEMRGEQIRNGFRGFIDARYRLELKDSLTFEAGDLALVHWAWTVTQPDGTVTDGFSAEVLRRQPDGRWLFVIDNSDGVATLGH